MNSFEPERNLVLDDHPGPAPRISREHAASMVEAALLGFDSVAQPAPRRGELGRMLAIAAAVLLIVVGGAAAARFYFDYSAPATAQLQQPAVVPRAAVVPRPADPSPPAPVVTEPEPEATPLAAAPKVRPVSGAAAPEDLLQKANRLRADGQFRDAAQTYTLVFDRFPKSGSAYIARVAAGAIELEHLSNPTRARRLFEQALREQPHGALDLEARQGLSVALRDLEDRPAEARTLQALVAAHPDSPAARRAQVRLLEIGTAIP